MKLAQLFEASDVTETPQFKKWFKNSKVVDSSGNPLVCYHGTPEDVVITTFDIDKANKRDPDVSVVGFHFTSRRDLAHGHGINPWGRPNAKAATVSEVYLSIQNPASRTDVRKAARTTYSNEETTKKLISMGFDGVLMTKGDTLTSKDKEILNSGGKVQLDKNRWLEKDESTDSIDLFDQRVGGHVTGYYDVDDYLSSQEDHYVAFFPNQIKSINNRGSFDPQSDHIDENTEPHRVASTFVDGHNIFDWMDDDYLSEDALVELERNLK